MGQLAASLLMPSHPESICVHLPQTSPSLPWQLEEVWVGGTADHTMGLRGPVKGGKTPPTLPYSLRWPTTFYFPSSDRWTTGEKHNRAAPNTYTACRESKRPSQDDLKLWDGTPNPFLYLMSWDLNLKSVLTCSFFSLFLACTHLTVVLTTA